MTKDHGPKHLVCIKKLTTLINDLLNYLPSLLNNVNIVMNLYSISVYKYKYTRDDFRSDRRR